MNALEITLAADPTQGDPSAPAYAALPPGATRGMVVIHDIFGRTPENDRVVERFADRGYAVIAPELFTQGRVACMRQVMRALVTGDDVAAVRLARRARRWLGDHAGLADGHIGIIGFCWGGGFALLAGPGFGAVSTNYGEVPRTPVLAGIGPVIGCYGGRDRVYGKTGELLRKRLAPVGIEPEVHVFPTVGHSFLTDGHHPVANALSYPLFRIRYDAEVAADAWQRIDAFFDRELGGSLTS